MRKKPNLEARLLRCAAVIRENPQELRGKWRAGYGFDKIRIEIGCGKGRFITECARREPDTLFIGIEREPGALVMAAEKAMSEKLENVLFLACDAQEIDTIFACGETDGLYLNFSDPWPRKKQAKRRLTHESFLEKYDDILSDDGFIFLKTDNEGLFEFSLNSFSDYGFRLKNVVFNLHANPGDNIVTEYEQRFSEQGMKIYRAEAYKTQGRVRCGEESAEKA